MMREIETFLDLNKNEHFLINNEEYVFTDTDLIKVATGEPALDIFYSIFNGNVNVEKILLLPEERQYLQDVINALGIKVTKIEIKLMNLLGKSCLLLTYENYYGGTSVLNLPEFNYEEKFSGLQQNREYTPEELGLE